MFLHGGAWKEPKYANCPGCGRAMTLVDSFTNQCDKCGQYTDGNGKPIRPPHEWEEPWED